MFKLSSLTLSLLLSICVIASAQNRPKQESKPFPITIEKMQEDLDGHALEDVRSEDGRVIGTWTFAEDEPKWIGLFEHSHFGDGASALIYLTTNDGSTYLRGKLRLHYQKDDDGVWALTSIENVSFKFYVYKRSSAPASAPVSTPAPQPRYFSIVNGSVAVNANSFYYVSFSVPASGGRVFGSFRAAGGRNDIRCWIVNSQEYENFKNRNAFRYFYDSNIVTVAQINLSLSGGYYYLIFDNRTALLTSKTVGANIGLEY